MAFTQEQIHAATGFDPSAARTPADVRRFFDGLAGPTGGNKNVSRADANVMAAVVIENGWFNRDATTDFPAGNVPDVSESDDARRHEDARREGLDFVDASPDGKQHENRTDWGSVSPPYDAEGNRTDIDRRVANVGEGPLNNPLDATGTPLSAASVNNPRAEYATFSNPRAVQASEDEYRTPAMKSAVPSDGLPNPLADASMERNRLDPEDGTFSDEALAEAKERGIPPSDTDIPESATQPSHSKFANPLSRDPKEKGGSQDVNGSDHESAARDMLAEHLNQE